MAKESPAVCIAVFSVQAVEARPRAVSRYELLLANPTRQHCWTTVQIQVTLREAPQPALSAVGPFVVLQKRIFIRSHENQAVTLDYNWDAQATFQIDGVRFRPDQFRRGVDSAWDAYYAVTATLLREGKQNEPSVMLVQHLMP